MTGGVVVVLGDTGRNFAAGMSGGIAYVYDPKARFRALCNPAMVELEAVAPASAEAADDPGRPVADSPSVDNAGMGDMLRFDADRLRLLIERHAALTGSARAKALLADWDKARALFVKVMPKDYRRALIELRDGAKAIAAE